MRKKILIITAGIITHAGILCAQLPLSGSKTDMMLLGDMPALIQQRSYGSIYYAAADYLEKNPGSWGASWYMAGAQYYMQRFEEATNSYEKAIKLCAGNDADYSALYYWKAICELRQGLTEKAIADITTSIGYHSYIEEDNPYKTRAEIYESIKQWDNAIADYNELIRTNTSVYQFRVAEAQRKIANCYIKAGKAQEAWQSLLDAEKSYLRDYKVLPAELYNDRAAYWLLINKPDEALKEINKGITIYPSFNAFYFTRAKSYTQLKQYDKATAEFKSIIANPVSDKETRQVSFNNLLNLYAATGNMKMIESLLQQAVTENNNDPAIREMLASVYRIRKQFDPSLKEYEYLSGLVSNTEVQKAHYLFEAGKSSLLKGDFYLADRYFIKALEFGNKDTILFERDKIYFLKNKTVIPSPSGYGSFLDNHKPTDWYVFLYYEMNGLDEDGYYLNQMKTLLPQWKGDDQLYTNRLFDMACACSVKAHFNEAIQYLGQALQSGYLQQNGLAGYDALYNDISLDELRKTQAYKAILVKYKVPASLN